ncbi:pyruvate dehydrogenase (acetyl-transferring) E1 component subunit alpha [Aromatoleum toluclasticum]|uniref:pyruvate dehydrogenase (acetyl-transferring) E1 component subunit alpha n=1 Tax=Aromatoleum toluclasticum TaxID=92003 RepID=UPI001D1800A9|nr:pyruvate dehydrogenase (acetyl-transferring) E1 component subunit alpha [Aromatoleum toluclasticum]MCC4116157.1 pyruvate dehydrogenase (acetyl-transferring) E1 component subunit alpha [Aromatoleum toluclasticum]
MTTVARFEVEFTRFLNAEGEATQELPAFARDPATLIPLYRAMQLTRAFDTKAIALQRTGKIGTFASALGQEAIGIGIAGAMRKEDVLVPSYRDHAAQFMRGVTMTESLLYWGGDERGSNFAVPREDFPICVPIGTQVCHAAGVAYAFKLRKEARVAACFLGDGATSKGDFYEALNFAAVWRAPLVVVINNNQWAISVPREQQTATPTLAQKAIAAGIEGVQVDGNDVIAVHDAARKAMDKARAGGGPSLIEAISYRLGDHTTADDATRYRDPDVVQQQWANEPIRRLRNYLARIGAWDQEKEESLLKECTDRINAAVEAYLAIPPPTTTAMFDHLYATLPAALQEQREAAQWFASHDGGGSHG